MDKDNELIILDKRKIEEKAHSDKRRSIVKAFEYISDTKQAPSIEYLSCNNEEYNKNFSNMKFYSISKSSFLYRDSLLFSSITGLTALDYCCGNGEVAVEMAKRGATRVVGIDISSVAIENANNLAKNEGVHKICEFYVMDAENTIFDDNTFDIIHEYGALHHLELNFAFKELCRLLKPNGRLICTEAMRHNPLIHSYRKMTPHLRTNWEIEHILGVPELEEGKKYFQNMHYKMFHLLSLAAVPFRKTSCFIKILNILNFLDSIILSIPYINWLAWVAIVEYGKPIKKI